MFYRNLLSELTYHLANLKVLPSKVKQSFTKEILGHLAGIQTQTYNYQLFRPPPAPPPLPSSDTKLETVPTK